ncbi:bifunctional riboflavin kinase/FAD synthetase [Arenimonas sp. GDDSR-1]|uniref:bifunctional riboflavin kinase/FAD synthetase n=1 Tax=Arenimonas sp. GDDSR-1 TaxID=2950125 RepID=UPI00261C435F|nr:bifunctional riboflavin kinase/FAD synthetase [Arenimonas sp. GDDSR-1]
MTVLFRDFSGPRISPRGSVVCIGAFDGLHLGHRHLLDEARRHADSEVLDLVVVSFEPLPREFFGKANPPPRLIRARQKFRALRGCGADAVGLLRFNQALADTPAETFITELLVQRLNARRVLVGPDFFFGKGRRGDLAMLKQFGMAHGFEAHAVQPQVQQGERISSSLIRADLQAGRIQDAALKLGRPYAIEGRVVRGQQLGRTLGYPTANIRLQGRKPALMGIYATWIHGVGSEPIAGVSSLGTRPTVNGREPLLEAHLFDFDGDLYGKHLRVEFVSKLRDEEKFEGLDALVRQMDLDAAQAREILARRTLGECA